MFLSHYHFPDDGFPNLEEIEEEALEESDSASVIRRSISVNKALPSERPTFSAEVCFGSLALTIATTNTHA